MNSNQGLAAVIAMALGEQDKFSMDNFKMQSGRAGGKFRSGQNTPAKDADKKRRKKRKATHQAKMKTYKSNSKRWA